MFSISFNKSALADLKYLKKSKQSFILNEVEEQLTEEPLKETRNRKPLRENDLASWEVRIGEIRVFYDVDEDSREVNIKAIGRKEKNTLYIRGKEYQL
jgi:mRNA-degrading endonuclease RelE of RelBE toxin-antitoxin system